MSNTFDPEKHARSSDPEVSHAAARAAEAFHLSHEAQIYNALFQFGPMTVDEIALKTGLKSQQVNKRLPGLLECKLAAPCGEGLSSAFRRCRMWGTTRPT